MKRLVGGGVVQGRVAAVGAVICVATADKSAQPSGLFRAGGSINDVRLLFDDFQ